MCDIKYRPCIVAMRNNSERQNCCEIGHGAETPKKPTRSIAAVPIRWSTCADNFDLAQKSLRHFVLVHIVRRPQPVGPFVGSDQNRKLGAFDRDPMQNFSRKIILNDDNFEVVVAARGVQASDVMPKNDNGRKFASSTVVMVEGDKTPRVSVPDIIPVVSAHDERILPLVVEAPVSMQEKNRRSKRSRGGSLNNNKRKGRDSSTTRYSPAPCTRIGRDPPGRKYQYQYVSHLSQGTLH